jgi:hypothetical protein
MNPAAGLMRLPVSNVPFGLAHVSAQRQNRDKVAVMRSPAISVSVGGALFVRVISMGEQGGWNGHSE